MKMIVCGAIAAVVMATNGLFAANAISAKSPDGRNEVRFDADSMTYAVLRDGVSVAGRSPVGMTVDGKPLRVTGNTVKSRKSLPSSKSTFIDTPVYKKSRIDLAANTAFFDAGAWGIRLVARNDGVAYRFETKMNGKIRIDGECASLAIPDADAQCHFCYGSFYGCEEKVPVCEKAREIATGKGGKGRFVFLPFVYSVADKYVAVTESDVCDYPILELVRDKSDSGLVTFGSDFAKFPKRTEQSDWDKPDSKGRARHVKVYENENFLVETDGTRTFPWRVFILADKPADFCAADTVNALARKPPKMDFSWVKPGKVAWDWWNCWDNKGQKDGCNTETYKRFIDFASKYGIEYVILDEGWSERLNIWKFHKNVDVPELIRYGGEKGVGIILWIAWAQAYCDEARVAEHFSKLGAKGFKVDFMDRGDADVERFLWKFADECAKNKMLVDYHGAHRPTGMSRTYPNVLNYEGVYGLEQARGHQNKFDFTANDVGQFFIRMTAGPMDYTPGAMDNYPVFKYAGDKRRNPGSIGTRVHQMAQMIAYEAPLQMLADAPTKYEKNMECFKFMAATPVVWDDVVGLGGSPDTFAAVARKAKDGSWFVAALNNKDAREIEIDLSFLGEGKWCADIFRDADDADENPTGYIHERMELKERKLTVRLASGGGFAAKISL